MLQRRIYETAIRESFKSNLKDHHMGCVIFQKNKILSTGVNMVLGTKETSMHAEAVAIERILRKHRLLKPFRMMLTHRCSLKLGELLQCRKGGSL